nr:hypothetical protein CoNPh37_CDS0155 [Staphylococcus phage S-CoN_Ph37]
MTVLYYQIYLYVAYPQCSFNLLFTIFISISSLINLGH